MKILDWIRIAKISDPFNTKTRMQNLRLAYAKNVSRGWPMQVVARLEICTMRMNIVLYYCTLLLTSSSKPVTRPTV